MMLLLIGMPAFGQYSLTNSTVIKINNDTVSGGEAANGYPSTLTVPTNAAGNLEKVTVTLNGFTHGYPNDVVLLLVAPNGYALPLMGNDGGGVAVANLTLTFDDVGSAATLSTSAAITNGTYKTGDNAAYGTTTPFPSPAPTANKSSLASFAGLVPTNYIGTWSLYVLDDSQPNTGTIVSWSLNLYTQPKITVTNAVTLSENTSTNISFTVSDTTSNATLTPTITLSNVNDDGSIGYTNAGGEYINFIDTNNVPADFVFSPINDNGTSTLTITPNANLHGTATFTINLTDGIGPVISSAPISLTVTPVTNSSVAPVISLANTTITTSNEVATTTNLISLISQAGNPGSTLQFSVVATNGIGNVGVGSNVFTSTAWLPIPATEGRTNNFYFSIVPGGFPIGTSYLNFIATDPLIGLSSTTTVAVVVLPLTNGPLAGPLVYVNTNSLNLAADSSAALSSISITNLTNIGLIGKVTVSVLGLTNVIPNHLGLELQAPNGTLVPLIVHPTSGSSPATYAEVTFADSDGLSNVMAGNILPTGTVLTNYVLNALGGTNALAAALGGLSPTNTGASNKWTLFVTNDSGSDVGISGGWVLDFYPAPVVQTVVSSITMPEAASTNLVFITSDTLGYQSGTPVVTFSPSVTPTYSDTPLATAIVLTNGTVIINGNSYTVGNTIVNGTNYTTNIVTLTGNPNETGTNLVTFTVAETNGQGGTIPSTFTAANSIALDVTFVAQAPSIGFVENQVTFAGTAVLNIPFVISSPDLDASNLTVTVTSSNPELLPTSTFQDNAVVTRGPSTGPPPPSPSVETNYLSLFPLGIKPSQSTITIAVFDGTNTASTSFLLVVGEPGSPLSYNSTPINITNNISVSNAIGQPYPTTNVVSGLVGTVENVIVTVFDVTEGHSNAAGLNLLLVGPTNAPGQSPAVYLIGDAGAGTGLLSANLIFSNALSGPNTNASTLPATGPILSDTVYSPTNYTVNAYTTPAPPSAPPPGGAGYGFNLVTSFKGINPNGVWSLYAFDGSNSLNGSIQGGWQLSIITAPHVSPATNVYTTLENVPTNIIIPVGDAESGNTSLTVTATVTPTNGSSATTITIASPVEVTNNGVANLAVLTITPNLYEFGTNNIHLVATDASGDTSFANLTFIVISNPQPPLILVTNLVYSTPAAIPVLVPFSVWDPQTTNQNTIQVFSSQPGLIPDSNITVITNGSAVNGTNSYSLNIQPVGVSTGSASITVTVIDGVGETAKTNFTITVNPSLAFASTNSITLGPGFPGFDLASSYPWIVTVPTNVDGLVSGVKVNLLGFSHNVPSDVEVLLVSPSGQSVVLMANAGGQTQVTNVNLEFVQSNIWPLIPQSSQLTNGTYRPANYASSLVFSNPAPGGPYSTNLATFDGTQPSGTWSLYLMDLGFPDSGSITSWILFLQTGPSITSIPSPQFVPENGTNNVPLVLSDFSTALSNLTVTAISTNVNVIVTPQGAGSPSGVTNLQIVPTPNYPSAVQGTNSTNLITVTVTDPSGNSVTNSFTLVVLYSPQAPVVSASTNNLVISENGSASITFTVSDVDAYLSSTTNISITSADPTLLLNSGIVTNSTFSSSLTPGVPGMVQYTITPVTNVFGTNVGALVFSIGNTNGEVTTTNITLSVVHVIQPPTIAAFSTNIINIFPGESTNIAFSVTTLESNATLDITAFSSNPSEVPNSPANIIVTPPAFPNVSPGTFTGTIELIIPSGAPHGASTILVTNTQIVAGTTNSVTSSFTVDILQSPTTVFANPAPIGNSATNPIALPYPSTNEVSGLVGGLFSASVTLNALSATVPSDVSILLEAPNGTSVLLLSDAGGTTPSANLTLTFADTNGPVPSTGPLAANGGSASYHPTGYNGNTNALPTNAPAPPYFDQLRVFSGLSGTNLNGTWSLWVVDNTTSNLVSIANGWTLSISTAPEIVLDNLAQTNLVIAENGNSQANSATVNFHVIDSTGGGSGDVVSVSSTPSSLFPAHIPISGPTTDVYTNDYTATLTPLPFASGPGTLTFTVTRVDGASDSVTLPVLITKSNTPPTLTRLNNITTNENSTGHTEFFVTELGDPLSGVTVAAYSSNQAVVANSNLTFTTGSSTADPGTSFNTNIVNAASFASSVPDAADIILNMTPEPNVASNVTIGIFVTNTDSAGITVTSNSFTFTLTPQTFAPTFTNDNIPGAGSFISVIGGSTTNIILQVTSLDAAPPVITLTGVNQSAPDGVTLGAIVSSGGSPSYNGTISNLAGATWTVPIVTSPTANLIKSTIQLTATDSHGLSVSTNFQVNTVPSEQHFYSNTNPINIVDISPSIPSPSPINVSGLVGLISQVVVNINGFGHQYPSDVGMLLVGPNGTNTVLMNNAGDGVSVSGLTLTFSELNAVGPAPASSQLFSETYLPSDYQPVKPYNFETNGPNNPTPPNPLPPNGPYATNLNVFNGLNPNANWYLYVQDDSPGDVGNITGGWTLQIITQPIIDIIGPTNLTVQYSVGGSASFVILDDSAVAALNYTTNSFGVTSSNSVLIPQANVTFTNNGTATNWTVFFNPALNEAGSSLITIYATNSYGQVASTSVEVTVTPVNFPPVITLPTNGSVISIPAGTPTLIPLGYYDTGFPTNSIIVSATSTALGGQNPVPASSLAFVGNGSGPSNLLVTPIGNATGNSLITLTVTQPVASNALSTNITFTVDVVPSTVPIFANTNPITIGTSPYPSQLTVSGVGSDILKVTATLDGFSHDFPSDVSIMLVGPAPAFQCVMLMSDEGGFIPVSNLRFTFDDAGVAMPANGPLVSGTNAPAWSDLNFTNGLPDVILPSAPSNSPPNPRYFHDLSAFSNTNPNGVWSLYVYDDNNFDIGSISGGWSLTIETIGPMITPLAPVTMFENTTVTIPFSIESLSTYASNITVTASATSEVPSNLVASLVINGQGTSNESLTITPTLNYPSAVTNINGTATITLVLTDTNNNASTNSFPLTVLFSDILPVIALPVTQTNTPANVPLTIPFTITDVNQGGTSNLDVTASITASLTTNDGTVGIITNGGGSYDLTFIPDGASNELTVSVVASDGTVSATNTIEITVTPGLAPVVSIVPALSTPENRTILVPFTLAYVPTNFTASNISGFALNSNLVPSVGISGAGSNYTATITPAPYMSGTTVITIAAQDQFGTGTSNTTLTVTFVEYPPTLGPILDTNTPVNTAVTEVLNVTDLATSITNLVYSANISDPNVIAAVNFSFNGSNELATIVPVTNKAGVSAITIVVSDGVTNVFQSFAVTVVPPTPPTLGAITNVTTTENTPAHVTLSVTSPVTPVTNLTFSGSSTNTGLVSSNSFAFSYNGSNEVVTITPVANAVGSATVTISVTDSYTTNSQSFTLQVTQSGAPTLSGTLVNGVLQITFLGIPGGSYNIQSSSDLKTWTTVATITANPVTGAVQYNAVVSNVAGETFYRAQIQ